MSVRVDARFRKRLANMKAAVDSPAGISSEENTNANAEIDALIVALQAEGLIAPDDEATKSSSRTSDRS